MLTRRQDIAKVLRAVVEKSSPTVNQVHVNAPMDPVRSRRRRALEALRARRNGTDAKKPS